ncbi:MAG: hypothetical protein ACYTGC_00390, partial [Planctomycetota bacterium]
MSKVQSRIRALAGVSIAFVLAVTSSARAGGDDCLDATPLTIGVFTGDTSVATNDGSAGCTVSNNSPDVWFTYTAPQDGSLSLDTCDSEFDTVLSIHEGCPGTGANQLACNDDACGSRARLLMGVEAGSTYLIRLSGWNGASGAYTIEAAEGPPLVGADIEIGELSHLTQVGREGDVVGCGLGSPVCNVGDEPLDWYWLQDSRHPFAISNLYRLENDRLQQIGQSWVKHGFAAAQVDACGLDCIPHMDSSRLGIGCSDTYGAGTNANRNYLGPRHEVDAWTGAWTFEGSHLDLDEGPHDQIEHRLQVHDDDLDPTLHPGGQYICELYVFGHDDIDHSNSIAWEIVEVSGDPGGAWTFNLLDTATSIGPAIEAWPGARLTVVPPEPVDDGRAHVAAKATEVGDGLWHYEYAVFNQDMDRGIGAVTIAIPTSAGISGIGFSAVLSHDEPYDNVPWTAERTETGLTWSTVPFDVDPMSNPLRWGTMYNFWFDADTPPTETTATLGIYEPGEPVSLSGPTTGPSANPADVDGDGVVGVDDLLALIQAWGPCPEPPTPCPADVDGDGVVGVGDLL